MEGWNYWMRLESDTHTRAHTHTHAHPITVIWVFLKDPKSLPNWSIRTREFWSSGILETSICIFAKGFFLGGGTNSLASECAGQTALDGLPTIWIKCRFNPFCLALGSLSFVPLGLGCKLLFFGRLDSVWKWKWSTSAASSIWRWCVPEMEFVFRYPWWQRNNLYNMYKEIRYHRERLSFYIAYKT